MSKYNSEIHHRRSIRLKGYDYSQTGFYFITICVQNREYLFGNITNGKMILNEAGQMVERWYYEIENKFRDIKCREMVIMPNHFHCILENIGPTIHPKTPVGADLRVCPYDNNSNNEMGDKSGERVVMGEHTGSPQQTRSPQHTGTPLHRVVQWFKTMTTNQYIQGVKNLGWSPFDGKLWQRNYYEHIIRNEISLEAITEYIIGNPEKWKEDTFFNID